jgi:hypothetical protein
MQVYAGFISPLLRTGCAQEQHHGVLSLVRQDAAAARGDTAIRHPDSKIATVNLSCAKTPPAVFRAM